MIPIETDDFVEIDEPITPDRAMAMRQVKPQPIAEDDFVEEDDFEEAEPPELADLPGYMKYNWMQDRANKE